MIQHVALETQPSDIEAHRAFWPELGFDEVPVPEGLRGRSVWFERAGQQMHLLLTDEPAVPPAGHVAIQVDDLAALPFELTERERYWGARRVSVLAPGGHLVELFEIPPARSSPRSVD